MSANGTAPESLALSGRPDHIEVQIGSETYHVTDQPVSRVIRQLRGIPELGQAVFSEDSEEVDFTGLILRLGDAVYEVVQTFVPDVMAKHRFHGYDTKAAYEADEYDKDSEAAKTAPSLPQLIDVFEAAYVMNDLARIQKMVGKALGPQLTAMFRKWVAAQMATLLAQSQTSASQSGSESESSGETTETSEAPEEPQPTLEGSPSPASLPS